MENILILVFGVCFGAVWMYFAAPKAPQQAPQKAKPVTVGEVTDLLDRLKPLAKDPNSRWQGVEVSFTGLDAQIKITTKEGNELTGRGHTLRDAVMMLDSISIRSAIQGWNERVQ